MWLFSQSDAQSALTRGVGSIGLNFSADPLPGFSLLNPNASNSSPFSVDGPYTLVWQLQRAQNRKAANEEVTLWTCLGLNSSTLNAMDIELARDSVKQTAKWMKTLRHPNILNWIAGTDVQSATKPMTNFHMVTEKASPLREYLRAKADSGNFNLMSSWGIYQISRALAFLNDDAKVAHNAVRLDAIFVTNSGEWKLAGLDFVGPVDKSPPSIRTSAAFVHTNQSGSDPYLPPDGRLTDSWGLGCLIWELFNPNNSLRDHSQLTSPDSLERLPQSLVPVFRRLVAPSASRGAKRRISIAQFLSASRVSGDSRTSGFFNNEYVDTLLFLEEFQLKDAEEKNRFFSTLTEQVTSFPDDVCRHKILPHLLNGVRFGSAGVEALIPVLRLIPLLSSAEFDSDVLPCLVKLFTSPERATRVRLLEQLPNFVQHLPQKAVESQIFTPLTAGFADSNPVVREATVRSMIHLAPKLSNKSLNDVLPRYLIGIQTKDDQGGIRTNATICLAKLAPHFSAQVQQGVLLNAFLRATRDPFIPSRKAALASLAATQEFYKTEQLACKILPCLSLLTVDRDKNIRDDVFRSIHCILDRLEQLSESRALDVPEDPSSGRSATTTTTSQDGPKSSTSRAAAAALGSLAWSALSFSSRLIANAASGSVQKDVSVKPDCPGAVDSSLSKDEGKVPDATQSKQTRFEPSPTKPVASKSSTVSSSMSVKSKQNTVPKFRDDDVRWGDDFSDDQFLPILDEDDDDANVKLQAPSVPVRPVAPTNLAKTCTYEGWERQPETGTQNSGWDSDDFFRELTEQPSRSTIVKKSTTKKAKPPAVVRPHVSSQPSPAPREPPAPIQDDAGWGDW